MDRKSDYVIYSLTIPHYGVFKYRINNKGLVSLDWLDKTKEEEGQKDPLGLGELLKRYFTGEKVSFNSIPLDYSNINTTYRDILEMIRGIPYGKIYTYSEIGELMGKSRYGRVVGNAMRINPFPIVVPCHRVVGKGSLGGYSLGLYKKIMLLRLEGIKIC